MVTPANKKKAVNHLKAAFNLSKRPACQLVGLSRTAYRYQTVDSGDEVIITRLKELAQIYPRYGYLMLHSFLKLEGLVVNSKRTYRLYSQLGLQIRTKKRGKRTRPRLAVEIPSKINQRWSMGFVSDQLANGRRFRELNVVDDYSRELVGQLVSVSISDQQVAC